MWVPVDYDDIQVGDVVRHRNSKRVWEVIDRYSVVRGTKHACKFKGKLDLQDSPPSEAMVWEPYIAPMHLSTTPLLRWEESEVDVDLVLQLVEDL